MSAVREAQNVVAKTRSDCRMCGSEELVKVWSFGQTPLANSYLKPEQAGRPEPYAPLDVYYCQNCHLVQLKDVVDPDLLFSNYLYVSSTSPVFVKHFEDFAQTLIERFLRPLPSSPLPQKKESPLVVDVGSNDGTLLKPLQKEGVKVLGIDPAENVAAMASAQGIETWAEYFTPQVAEKVVQEKGRAQVITANNVFAHTDEVDIFAEAVKRLLAPDGVFVFEVQYLADLMAKNLFDIVYHEHVCYYSVHPLVKFFQKHNLEVFDVERPPVHGGSLRVFAQRKGGPRDKSARLYDILREEKKQGLTGLEPYRQFADRIEDNKKKLQEILRELKSRSKRIAGYGAPAKATTLCHALGLDGQTLDFIVDDSKIKQGLLMPGTRVPILPPDKLYEDKPDYCLILAWNFAEPIMKNHGRFVSEGGRFIIPAPEPRVI